MSMRIENRSSRSWEPYYPLLQELGDRLNKDIIIKPSYYDDISTLNTDSSFIHVYSFGMPTVIREHFNGDTSSFRTKIDSEEIIYHGDAAFRYNEYTIKEYEGFNCIRDDNNILLALTTIDNNNLFIVNNIAGHSQTSNRDEIKELSYIINHIDHKDIDAEEANRMNPEEVTATFIQLYKHQFDAKGGEEAALKELDRRVSVKYREYLNEIKAVSKDYRLIKSARIGDLPSIISKANAVTKSLTSNPFIRTLAIENNHLRVTIKSILSKYYEGEKSLIITIPIFVSTESNITVKVYELMGETVTRLPYYEDHIYPESNICLGSLNETIAQNLLGGDWDLATMSIIRGMIGGENRDQFSEMLKWYASNKSETKLSRAIIAAYSRNMCCTDYIFNKGGGEVESITDSENGNDKNVDDSDGHYDPSDDCNGQCYHCSEESCDNREEDQCDDYCRQCTKRYCDDRGDAYCDNDCRNCGNDCDDRPCWASCDEDCRSCTEEDCDHRECSYCCEDCDSCDVEDCGDRKPTVESEEEKEVN